MILTFATPAGHHTRAPPESIQRDADGREFVWIDVDGNVTKAYKKGSL